jgi:hypothetical protein
MAENALPVAPVQNIVRRLRVISSGNSNRGAIAKDVDTGKQHNLCYFCGLPRDEHQPKCPDESTRSFFVE